MEFQLVLVRHGYSLGNEKSLFSGWSDVPLTERGRRELRELRQVIRYPRTGRYFSSDLSRCRETFQELYGPHIVLDGLRPEFREICFGSLENRPGTQEDFMHFFRAWLAGHPILDVETYKAFRRRVLEAVAGLMRDCLAQGSQSATVGTHSGLIKTAVTALTRAMAADRGSQRTGIYFDTFRRERSEAFLAAASINLFSKRCCGRNILIVLLKVGHPHYESPFLSHGRETL